MELSNVKNTYDTLPRTCWVGSWILCKILIYGLTACLQVLVYTLGTALMPAGIERVSGKWGGENRRKEEERERSQKEGKGGEEYLLRRFNHNMGSLISRLEGQVSPKHFWPPNVSWLLAYLCNGLAVPTKVSSYNALPGFRGVVGVEPCEQLLKGFYLNYCVWFFHNEQVKQNTLHAVICKFNKLLKRI